MRAPGLALAERIPLVGVRDVEVDLVDVVGPADQLPLVVVQRDEEVVRVHELADDGVHLAVELLHVLRRARELGDPVQRRLNPLGASAVSRDRHLFVRSSCGGTGDSSIVRNNHVVSPGRVLGCQLAELFRGPRRSPGSHLTAPSTTRLHGTAGPSPKRRRSRALDAPRNRVPANTADADVDHVTGPAGFLNRVHKFDSCRGHEPRGRFSHRACSRTGRSSLQSVSALTLCGPAVSPW